GLAGAVVPEQAQHAAGLQLERHIVQRDLAVLVDLGELVRLNHQVAGALGHEAASSARPGRYTSYFSPRRTALLQSAAETMLLAGLLHTLRATKSPAPATLSSLVPMSQLDALRGQAARYFQDLQDRICTALAELDGRAGFREDTWQRPG